MSESNLLFLKISDNPNAWEYGWFQLPYALPGFLTFIIGIFLSYISLISLFRKPKEERMFFINLILCFIGNGFLGLVLGLRAIILDKELLLFLNNYLYIFVMLLSPSGHYIAYQVTGKKYKSLIMIALLCWITYLLGTIDVFRFHTFQNIWLEYPFGNYPKANIFVSLWGIVPSIGCLFSIIPSSIRYAIKNKERVNIPILLGLNLIFFLPVTNLPSILGYKFYPGANFLFIPMLIFAYGVFRSDFLDLNELMFQKRGLFYIITVFFTLLFACIFLCVIAFLRPNTEGQYYSNSYFLIPLMSGFFVFILAIYLAGSNPNEKINIMAAISLLISGIFMISGVARALSIPPIVSWRIDQLCYLFFSLAPSIQLRFVLMVMRLPPPKYVRLIDISSIGLAILSQTPYFFGEGIYSYSFGYVSQGGIGLSLFGLLGFVSVSLCFYYWWKNRNDKTAKGVNSL